MHQRSFDLQNEEHFQNFLFCRFLLGFFAVDFFRNATQLLFLCQTDNIYFYEKTWRKLFYFSPTILN
jgi:hypothetical protein